MLCNLAYSTRFPSAGIFIPDMSRSVMLIERVAFQNIGEEKLAKILVSCYIASVVDAVIEAEKSAGRFLIRADSFKVFQRAQTDGRFCRSNRRMC
jgi:hypothetical protein